MTRFALVVPFPEAAPVVDVWRERTCLSKPSHGVPAHVTLLVPSPHDEDALAGVLRPFPLFDVAFDRLDRFPGTLWLAPEPVQPFRAMIDALARRFPGHPPYGGVYGEPVPHLTVAQGDLAAAAEALEQALPIRTRAEAAVLLEQVRDDRWREVARIPFEGRE